MFITNLYYSSILGGIRFLGIGVGNEDARASLVFTISIIVFISIVLNFFGIDFRNFPQTINISFVLVVFLLTYFYFSNEKNKSKIENLLINMSRKSKIIIGFMSLIFFLTLILSFFKIYA